jgi:hypothetical protein
MAGLEGFKRKTFRFRCNVVGSERVVNRYLHVIGFDHYSF